MSEQSAVWIVTSGHTDNDYRITQGACLTVDAAFEFASSVRKHISRVKGLSSTWNDSGVWNNGKRRWTNGRDFVEIEAIDVVVQP